MRVEPQTRFREWFAVELLRREETETTGSESKSENDRRFQTVRVFKPVAIACAKTSGGYTKLMIAADKSGANHSS